MDVEVPELSGHLIVPTQTGFSLNRISKKKSSSHKYCLLFRASRHGIERLEICDSRDDTRTPKIITLENCVKITHEPAPALLIHIVTKTDTLTLNALTADDLKLWLAALQSVAFRDKAAAAAAAAAAAHRQTPNSASIEEDNDLYCSSYVDDGCFVVRLVPSDASQKCALSAHRTYVLHLTATDLQLKCADESSQQIPAAASATPSAGPSSTSTAATTPTSGGCIGSANIVPPINQPIGAVAAKWPYRYIRKYGYRDGKFTFEAGRKCETGEGVFSLEHPHPLEVFRCMTAKMKTMKKLISGDSMTSLDCGEHQFNAALSMEAGSRSPLPPSPNHHSTHMMLGGGGCATDSSAPVSVDSTHSGLLLRGFLSSNDSLMSAGSGSVMNQLSGASTPQIKAVPSKPPRKSIGTMLVDHLGGKYHKFQNYEHVSPPPTSQNVNTSVGDSSSGAVTNADLSGNKTPSATIILKTPPAADSHKTFHLSLATTPEHGVGDRTSECPPKLPVRNESKSNSMTSGGGSDDYECVKTITNAWRTHGLNDVRHTEQRFGVGAATPVRTNLPLPPVPQQQQQGVRTQQQQPLSADSDAELTDYVWQRSQSQKEPSSGGNRRHSPPHSTGGKQLQTTVSVSAATTTTMLSPEDDYDRLQFFGPNKTATAGNSNSSLNSNSQNGGSCSSDYKTIITVTSPGYKKQTSLPAACNDYEVIGAGNSATPTATTASVGKRSLLDLQLTKSRMADDSFAGYGVLRKSAGSGGLVEVQPTAVPPAASPSHAQHYHPEMSYAIVSKPKRV